LNEALYGQPLDATQYLTRLALAAPGFTLASHRLASALRHSDYLDVHFPIDRGCKERNQEREPPKTRHEVVPADLVVAIYVERLEQLQHLSKVTWSDEYDIMVVKQRYVL